MARQLAGIVIVLFQLNIFISGNLSLLNVLTMVPALACFDDRFLSKLLPRRLARKAETAQAAAAPSRAMQTTVKFAASLLIVLSIQPAMNLLSSRQIMNTSFEPFDLVNTYGAFGTVGTERFNVVFEGTLDNDTTDNATWKPYIYKGLPVLLDKRPPQIAPYQLRLDWQMWFAAMASPGDYPWTYNLVWKLLHNDPLIGLFANNPFPDKPPRYVRAILYRYSFAKPSEQHLWWSRQKIDTWIRPLSTDDQRLVDFLKGYGWLK
jgi:hypothetical protein